MRSRNSLVKQTSEPWRAAALCAAVAVCFAPIAMAGDPPAADAAPAAEAAVAPSEGMRVAVDPETGALRPITAKEAKALDDITKAKARAAATARAAAGGDSNSTSSAAAPGETFVDPSGAIGMVLDSSHMVYSVATVGEDGKVRMECITGEDHAHDAVHDHAHADKNAEEKNDATK